MCDAAVHIDYLWSSTCDVATGCQANQYAEMDPAQRKKFLDVGKLFNAAV
jgi:hypothetical protein